MQLPLCVNPLPKDPQVGPLSSQPPEAARGHAAHDGQRGRLLRPPHALHFHIQVGCSNRSHMKRKVITTFFRMILYIKLSDISINAVYLRDKM